MFRDLRGGKIKREVIFLNTYLPPFLFPLEPRESACWHMLPPTPECLIPEVGQTS